MESLSIANCKVHILYMVKNAPEVSYQMLYDKCMESLYMDYFNFSQAYNDLLAGNLLSKVETSSVDSINKLESLTITKAGEAILEDVEDSLNPQTHAYLVKASSELKNAVAYANSIKAIIEGSSVRLINSNIGLELTISCSSYEEATTIANKWRKDAESLSSSIVNLIK